MALVAGICGSPRKGATEYALRMALESASQVPGIKTDFWGVRGKKIKYCTHCDRCIKEKTMCHTRDDIVELEELVLKADGLIVASPVYDMNITAQLAACFNRLRPIYLVHPGGLKFKVGGVLVTAGTRHGGQETAIQAVHNFYLMHEMLVTGGVSGCYSGGKIWSKDQKAQGVDDDQVGRNTVNFLGRAVGEATMLNVLGRKEWDKLAAERGYNQATGEYVEDHAIIDRD